MLRFFSLLGVVCLVAAIFVGLTGSNIGQAGAPSKAEEAPPGPCTYTPFGFSLVGTAPIEDMRSFATSPGEGYLQFAPGLPITTTASSSGKLLLNNTYTGTVSGNLSGTFVITNLNGIAITGSTVSPEGRGILINNLVVSDAGGSMNLLLALNFASTTASAPYYPRSISGYVQAISTSGSYAPYRYAGTIQGTMSPPENGTITLNASIQGKLYTGFTSSGSAFIFSGSRELPPARPVPLQPTDVLAQFYDPDIVAGATAGNIYPLSVFSGSVHDDIEGSYRLSNNEMLVGSDLVFSPGWLAGNWELTTPNGDRLYGPWLSDLPGVQFDGFLFQSGGTGAYANSLMFGRVSGAIAYQGGEDIAGGSLGYFCTEMVPVGGTVTPTVPPSATTIPTSSATSTVPASASATSTSLVPSPTLTSIPSSATTTVQATATQTEVATETSTALSTETTPPTATTTTEPTLTTPATVTIVPSTTPTTCTLEFADMPPGSTFYSDVMCLACQGIVSGYPCGGAGEPCDSASTPYFRPGNNVTRGQVAKIVALAASFTDPVSGQTFEDVPPGSTFYEYVQKLSDREMMSGYPCGGPGEPCSQDERPYFRPNGGATRGQLSKIVSNAAGFNEPITEQTFEDVPPGHTFYEVIGRLAVRGVMSGYHCGNPEPCTPPNDLPYFRPSNHVTRGQTAKIVGNGLMPECNIPALPAK